MPQATNPLLQRMQDSCPVGRGTVYSTTMETIKQGRRRANRANQDEQKRLDMLTKMLDKHHQSRATLERRVINRHRKSLEQIQAYKTVLDTDYKVDDFMTLRRDYTKSWLMSASRKRKVNFETKIYNSGFSMKCLRPEIDRKLRESDPALKIAEQKEALLNESRERYSSLMDYTTEYFLTPKK